MPSDPPVRKLRRVSRACDFCHSRSSRCQQSPKDRSRCQNCIDFDIHCTYARPVQKRGLKSKGSFVQTATNNPTLGSSDPADHEEQEIRQARRHNNLDFANMQLHNGVHAGGELDTSPRSASTHWQAEPLPNQETISALVETYFDVVYPMWIYLQTWPSPLCVCRSCRCSFPLFHRPSLRRRVANHEYLSDQGLLTCVMVICALASARIRDGAASSSSGMLDTQNWSSEAFHAIAQSALPKDLSNARGLHYVRTFALLALLSIQS